MPRKAKKRTYVHRGKGAKAPQPSSVPPGWYRASLHMVPDTPINPTTSTSREEPPPYKARLEELRNALSELLGSQRAFLDYIDPMPNGTEKSPEIFGSSFTSLMNELENLVGKNRSLFQNISSRF